MDTVIGIVGKDFILMAADTQVARSILVLKNNADKIVQLDSHKILGCSGETGDSAQFSEYIAKNIAWQRMRSGLTLSTKAAAHFTRGELAKALRKNPYQTNLLLGGFTEEEGPLLFYIDYLSSMHSVKYGVQGHASNFLLSVLDKEYKEGLTVQEATQILEHCFFELKTRFLINTTAFAIKVVDKEGVRVLVPPNEN